MPGRSPRIFIAALNQISVLFTELKKIGITTIVGLGLESPHTAEEERKRAEAMGMRFQRIPMGGFSTPRHADLARFFSGDP